MDKNKSASSEVFGFDFQVNAAIILMLENIEELNSLRLEGNLEDIELYLNDGKYILAQAKAVVKSSSDFRNVRRNLKKALETLSEGAGKSQTKQLILITNSPNPLNDEASRNLFTLDAHRPYDSLPRSSQKIIDKYLKNISAPLDTSKFMIQILPYETDIDEERYKFVRYRIDDFIGSLSLNSIGLGKQIMTIWHHSIFINGTKNDRGIELRKKDIIWPIILIVTNINRFDEDLEDHFDASLYNEIVYKYHEIIDYCCERIDFFIKVLYDYNTYHFEGTRQKDKCWDFATNKWEEYESEFDFSDIDSETKKGLIKIVLYSIVRDRISIKNIKERVNL